MRGTERESEVLPIPNGPSGTRMHQVAFQSLETNVTRKIERRLERDRGPKFADWNRRSNPGWVWSLPESGGRLLHYLHTTTLHGDFGPRRSFLRMGDHWFPCDPTSKSVVQDGVKSFFVYRGPGDTRKN